MRYNWANEIRNGSGDACNIPEPGRTTLEVADVSKSTSPSIPYGYCQCGCGQPTRLAPYNDRSKGWISGEPLKYILGHRTRQTIIEATDTPETFRVALTGGLWTLIDAEDIDRVRCHTWSVFEGRNGIIYAQTMLPRIGGRKSAVYLHRFILDAPSGMVVDHANHDGLDNRRCNLRLATEAQNSANRRSSRWENGHYKGAYRVKHGWRAVIQFHGKSIYIGTYSEEVEAARAYDEVARQLFGEFALLNFPDRK